MSVGRRWYLVAWDVGRRDWRTFRVDRLGSDPEVLTRFNPRELPGGDAAAFVAAAIDSISSRVDAVATVRAPAEEIHEAAGWCGATAEPVDATHCRVHLSGESVEWVAACLGLLGHDFEVHSPPELVEEVGRPAERFTRASSGGG